ncbi:hypothetical protein MYOV011v1_p0243 [Vibrio phage 6E35.1a]|nr:hypothetical protein MYOV011v1_p0243 [Vibrio phage 6E35.1a]
MYNVRTKFYKSFSEYGVNGSIVGLGPSGEDSNSSTPTIIYTVRR